MTTERERGLSLADDAAKKINRRFGVRSASHIKIEAYAAAYGLRVVESKLDGARARLGTGRKPIIRVSDRACHPGDRTFSIAHELGHHVLGHAPSRVDALCKHVLPCRLVRSGTARHPEAEANTLAAGICMPSELLAKPVASARPSRDIAHAIAAEFTMPLTATAIRFAELTPERCAAVYSEAGRVVWAVRSKSFHTRVPRGKRLEPGSLAYNYGRDGRIDERPRSILAATWIPTADDTELVEHSVVLGHDAVITLLWAPEGIPANETDINSRR